MTYAPLQICTATDNNYTLPLCLMLHSLGSNLDAMYKAVVTVLTTNLSESNRELLRLATEHLPVDIKFVEVSAEQLRDLKVDGHITSATYLRLQIDSYFTEEMESVLYLDADIVVKDSVHKLFTYPFGSAVILAAPHVCPNSAYFSSPRGLPSYKLLGLPPDGITFNAGVMLINLQKWRDNSVAQRTLSYLHCYSKHVLWWDQDALNAVLHDKWRELPARWNVTTRHYSNFRTWRDSLLTEEQFTQAWNNPGIIHFCGTPKPWEKEYVGPFKRYWEEALATFPSLSRSVECQ